jgi:hypothetical protein
MPTNFSPKKKAEGRKIAAKLILNKHDLRNELGSKQRNVLEFCKQNSELLGVPEGVRAAS